MRFGRGATLALLLWLGASSFAAGCGHYGPPVRAEEYREKEKQKEAEKAKKPDQSPESTNQPLPSPY